jgi:hypothetical protein
MKNHRKWITAARVGTTGLITCSPGACEVIRVVALRPGDEGGTSGPAGITVNSIEQPLRRSSDFSKLRLSRYQAMSIRTLYAFE